MLKIFSFIISLFLIGIITSQVPRESVGLATLANKTELLGSPSSAQRFLNILIGLGILFYLIIALVLNFQTN